MSAGVSALVGVFLGGAIGLAGSVLLYRWQRRDARDDRRYAERSKAYVDFLVAAHDCAHRIGMLARHDEHGDEAQALPSAEERMRIAYEVDAFAAKHVRVVEIVGPPSVEEAAQALLRALYAFRHALQRAASRGDPVPYDFNPRSRYLDLLNPYREARHGFTDAAKAELRRLSGSADDG